MSNATNNLLDFAITQFGKAEREYRVWFRSNGVAVVDVYSDGDVQTPIAQVKPNEGDLPDVVRF